MVIRKRTWALVASGTRARILQGLEDPENTDSAEVICTSKATHLREIMSDRSGRSFASDHSGRRSAMEPGSDPIQRDMHDFASDLLDRLEKHRSAGDFDRIGLFAAPVMLGALRKEMPPALREAVIFEEPLNLVRIPESELREAVRGKLLGRD